MSDLCPMLGRKQASRSDTGVKGSRDPKAMNLTLIVFNVPNNGTSVGAGDASTDAFDVCLFDRSGRSFKITHVVRDAFGATVVDINGK